METLVAFIYISVELATFITSITVFIIMAIGLSINYFFTRKRNKITKTRATILSKTTKLLLSPSLLVLNNQITKSLPTDIRTFTITFKTSNSKHLAFEVSENMYKTVTEGQTDTLIYEGEDLLQFGNWKLASSSACASFCSMWEGNYIKNATLL